MRLLLDTHALLWWLVDQSLLGKAAHRAISDDHIAVWVSAVSAMEISTKVRLGKLPQGELLTLGFEAILRDQGFSELPISVSHARLAGSLPIPHKDPFDRLLIAQAHAESMTLVSNEVLFDSFGVSRLW